MKKFATLLLLVICTVISSYAVPRGSYYDNRGRLKVLVDDNGDIHILDRQGNVSISMEVIQENQDGTFATKVYVVNGHRYNGTTYYNNDYFYENGKLRLNLQNWHETLTKE